MAAKTPQRISLRVYPVGFGDCFLHTVLPGLIRNLSPLGRA